MRGVQIDKIDVWCAVGCAALLFLIAWMLK